MEKNKKKNEIKIVRKDNVENIFTDIIQLHVNQETVNIELAIRDIDNSSAKVSHNVIMTLPHFMRFAEVCQKTSEHIASKIDTKQEK